MKDHAASPSRTMSADTPVRQTTQSVAALPLLTVAVPGRPPDLANARDGHWSQRHKASKPARQAAYERALLAGRLAGILVEPRVTPRTLASGRVNRLALGRRPRVVTAFIAIWPRRWDPDNALHNLKPFFDGLVDAGLLVNDSVKWVLHAPVVQEIAAHALAQETVIRVYDSGALSPGDLGALFPGLAPFLMRVPGGL